METETLDLTPPENLTDEAAAVWLRGTEAAAETRREREAKNALLESGLQGRPSAEPREPDVAHAPRTIPGIRLEGLAYPWFDASADADGRRSAHAPGTVDLGGDVGIRVGHSGPTVATAASGTARIWESARGIEFACEVADSPEGRALVAAIQEGNWGCSISTTHRTADAEPVRLGPATVTQVGQARLQHIGLAPRRECQCKRTGVAVVPSVLRLPP